jgi:hypothetical protein
MLGPDINRLHSKSTMGFLTTCSGKECPLKEYCLRYQMLGKNKGGTMLEPPFVWSDYMMQEQGYADAYCEFYFYSKP